MKASPIILAVMLAAVPASRAQLVNDGATNTLSNVTTNITGDVTVGTNGSFTLLVLSNNTLLTNSANGIIGLNTTARSNAVFLTGTNTRWLIVSNLLVGSNGSFNTLIVSNDGVVTVGSGVSVGLNSNAVNNRVLLSTGALLSDAGGAGGLGIGTGANSNSAIASDANTRWLMEGGSFIVGSNGAFNQLVLSNGALLVNLSGNVGFSSGANSNAVLLTGLNSVWSNRSDIRVGNSGSFNQVVVSNGATLFSGTGDIGFGSSANNNVVLITGSNSVWGNANGTILRVGRNGSFNQLVVSNGATVFNSLGSIGTLGPGGVIPGAKSNVVLVTGLGSSWSNRTDLRVGDAGSFNQLVVSNGATVFSSTSGDIGFALGASNNAVLVTGTNSAWTNTTSLRVGNSSSFNQLVVSNGAIVFSGGGDIGFASGTSNNVVVVSGSNSLWGNANGTALRVGRSGSFNQLVVSNGATVLSSFVSIGAIIGASNNVAVVTGVGSLWSSRSDLVIGDDGVGCRLVISNGGAVFATNGLYLGSRPASTGNRLTINGGSVTASNGSGTGAFDLRRGTNEFNSGLIDVDQLVMTNAPGQLEFNGGTLSTRNSTVSNGQLFRVGNGVSAATLQLAGNGLHDFTGTPGVSVSSNATLTGNGTLSGALTVSSGGQLSPGASVGKIVLSNSPSLLGTVRMEISKNGTVLTNDQIQVNVGLTYGGSLTVSNLGSTALAIGDRFPLFSANSYSGSFSVISLPTLPAGLNWTNKLLVDGSIEVVAGPQFTSVTLSGTNVIFTGTGGTPNAPYAVLTATNVALPLTNWTSIATNLFDSSGNFSFANAIVPGISQRFFWIRTP